MLRFRQFTEQASFIDGNKLDWAAISNFPISIDAKSLAMARKELWDIMKEDDRQYLDELRLVFDKKKGHMYAWAAINTTHEDIIEFYKIKEGFKFVAAPERRIVGMYDFNNPYDSNPVLPKKYKTYLTKFLKGIKTNRNRQELRFA